MGSSDSLSCPSVRVRPQSTEMDALGLIACWAVGIDFNTHSGKMYASSGQAFAKHSLHFRLYSIILIGLRPRRLWLSPSGAGTDVYNVSHTAGYETM